MGNKSKILYIDNVTTYDYIKNYSEKHSYNDSFTYVTFSEYSRENSLGYTFRHGDIFFNGDKITYLNDACNSSLVTDGLDVFMAYINDSGCVDIATIGIRISYNDNNDNDVKINKYEMYNVNSDLELSYELVNTIENYAVVTDGQWMNSNVAISDNKISASSGNYTLSYSCKVNDIPCVAYAYLNIYNLPDVESLSIVNFPYRLTYNSIYTPRIEVTPYNATQSYMTWTAENESYVQILNRRNGMFRCLVPGQTTYVRCSYNIHEPNAYTDMWFEIAKINPYLSISAYYSQHLYNASHSSTNCYVSFDNCGFTDYTFTWKLNQQQTKTGTSGTNNEYEFKSPLITYTNSGFTSDGENINNPNPSGPALVQYILPFAYFYPNTATMQLYRHAPGESTIINIDGSTHGGGLSDLIDGDFCHYTGTLNDIYSFVVVSYSEEQSQQGGGADVNINPGSYIDTDFIFNSKNGNLSDFVITDITYSGNYVYTYVSAQINVDPLNSALYDIYGDDANNYISYESLTVISSRASMKYDTVDIPLTYESTSYHIDPKPREANI